MPRIQQQTIRDDMPKFDANVLSEAWTPTEETLALLKLNSMTDEHINNSLKYLKGEYPNTHIDDIPNYDTWSSLFVMFCIKASRSTAKPSAAE